MIFKATISNKAHPEFGQAVIPFPIPDSEYDRTIGLLEDMDIGSPTGQDCWVDRLESQYPILNRLTTQNVNVDELDYLAKRLGSFFQGEDVQFEAMACKLGLSDIKDFINLTFVCQQATVITDFSDLERVGKEHSLNINGGSMPTEEYDRLEGRNVALDLILNSAGVITPYGVVYDNGMKLEPLYDGRYFPEYHYKPPQMMVEIKSGQDGAAVGYLYLPCPDRQIERTLQRAAIVDLSFQAEVTVDDLPLQVSARVSPTRDGLGDLNALCRVIEPLSAAEKKKLEAVVLMIRAESAREVRQLAENLDQFDFMPKPDSPAADSELTELGYVAYHGSLTLGSLTGAPREPSRRRVTWGEEPQRNERVLSEGQDERYEACGNVTRDDPVEQEPQMGGFQCNTR